MKKIILTSAVLFTIMTVLMGLSSMHIMAQETPLGMDTNNMTGTDTNNMTGTDTNNMTGTDTNETTEADSGMISRRD